MIRQILRRVRGQGRTDGGAVLVLAVLFVLIVGVTGGAIASLATTNLAVTSVLGGDQTQSYAAQSAVQIAVDSLRGDTATTSTAGYFDDNGVQVPCQPPPIGAGILGAGSPAMTVMCAVTFPEPYERTILLAACPAGTSQSNCLTPAGVPGVGVIVLATLEFHDLVSRPDCNNVLVLPSGCFVSGTAVDVTNWTISKSDS